MRPIMSYICNILTTLLPAAMPSFPDTPVQPLLRLLLERVLRTEYLVLESLRLQTQGGYHSLPGGDGQRLQAAEQRAYQQAEMLLTQLLAVTTVPAVISLTLPASDHDLR